MGTFQAMMTLNICIDSYGVALHLMDVMFATGMCHPSTAASERECPMVDDFGDGFDVRVRSAVDELPIEQAQAVWLVDVCSCSYDEAAREVGISRTQLCARVAEGRRFVRYAIEPAASWS